MPFLLLNICQLLFILIFNNLENTQEDNFYFIDEEMGA